MGVLLQKQAAACLAVAAGLLVMTTTVALASNGAGTTTTTQQARNVLFFSNPTQNPCTGDAGTITAVAKTEKFHITTQADGNFWMTGSAQGTVAFAPTDPSAPSASGHFATWFGESSNEKNDVQHDTATFQLWTTDGHHVVVKMKDHLSTNANGVVTVNFSNMSLSCK
jgi:hypothetical protein